MVQRQSLESALREAESCPIDETGCTACKIAAGIGISTSLCEEFKGQLDCRELMAIIDNPELYTLEEVQTVIEKIAKHSCGKARELLTYTLCLMKGECSLDEPPPSLKG